MANPEHVAKLLLGGQVWNEWIMDQRSSSDLRADLSESLLMNADLSGANLTRANLTRADLSGADLSNAYLNAAILTDSNLTGTNLTGADLQAAYLRRTCLKRANLTGALLSSASIWEVDMEGAHVQFAQIYETSFVSTDLSKVLGLASCIYDGPSLVDHQTLALSRRLPLEFLRGVGLPNTLIEYLPSLFGQGIEFQSCFISYSTRDQEFADRLYADLQNKGVRCWFAPHDIQGGKKIHEQIDRAIQMHDRLLLLLSEHSMGSEWVKTEIATAREREAREGRQVLFPLALVGYEAVKAWRCFDADRGKDSAREIREYYVPDFSGWKDHDSYSRVFEKLVRDLKAKETGAGAERLG